MSWSGHSSQVANRADLSGVAYADLLEQQNQDRIQALSGKVGAMKELAIQINEEVITQNRFLDQDLSDSMGRTVEQLRNSMRKLEQLVRSGSSYALCYGVLGIVGVLFLLHWLFPR
jgi:predicted P-loop ATPase